MLDQGYYIKNMDIVRLDISSSGTLVRTESIQSLTDLLSMVMFFLPFNGQGKKGIFCLSFLFIT